MSDGRRAVGQKNVYEFLTGKTMLRGARNALGMSNLRKYLPEQLLVSKELVILTNGEKISVFLSGEWVSPCIGVLLAGFNNNLSKTWERAVQPAQITLMAFAQHGVDYIIDQAIKNNPPMTHSQFDKLISGFLGLHL
ncbi:MAG: hypothetical protein JKY70_07680 [Mucilaginibacter sp.]|nr:hypothetical protein [Mucilaginibacter sp.]